MKKTYIRQMAEAINLNLESPIMEISGGSPSVNDQMPEDDALDNILSDKKGGWSSDSWTLND